MSHQFFEGRIYHKRYTPKEHAFSYRYFFLDIDNARLDTLENSLFGNESFNLFSFKAADHFGRSGSFKENVTALLKQFNLNPPKKMRFITLPRIANFVFNPISVLVLFDGERPSHLLAEVHNYNGGRTVYPVRLSETARGDHIGEAGKNMYVSPFFDHSGSYRFRLRYTLERLELDVDLQDDRGLSLHAAFKGSSLPFRTSTVLRLFGRHTLLTFWVVTRTLWESFRLWKKGLQWHSPQSADQIRRY